MPIYEYKCEDGHVVSIIFKTVSKLVAIDCPGYSTNKIVGLDELFETSSGWIENCPNKATREWSLPAKSAPNDNGKGLIYFENEKGQIEFNSFADRDNWHPKGFVKKEARNLHEREVLEQRLRRQDNSRISKTTEQRDIHRHYSEQVRHSDLRNAIQQGAICTTDNDGKQITINLDEKSKSLLKRGMERTNKRKQKKAESEFRLSVNHDSASTIRNKA